MKSMVQRLRDPLGSLQPHLAEAILVEVPRTYEEDVHSKILQVPFRHMWGDVGSYEIFSLYRMGDLVLSLVWKLWLPNVA